MFTERSTRRVAFAAVTALCLAACSPPEVLGEGGARPRMAPMAQTPVPVVAEEIASAPTTAASAPPAAPVQPALTGQASGVDGWESVLATPALAGQVINSGSGWAAVGRGTATQAGDVTFFSDGTWTRRSGDTFRHSEGGVTVKRGDTYFHSDGSWTRRVGDVVTSSSGKSCVISGSTMTCP